MDFGVGGAFWNDYMEADFYIYIFVRFVIITLEVLRESHRLVFSSRRVVCIKEDCIKV